MEVCTALTINPRSDTGIPERNGLFFQTVLIHKLQPYTFCHCLDRAGTP